MAQITGIGTVQVTQEWQKLEDLIKELDGKSAFAFDTSKEYKLQIDSANSEPVVGVYLCMSSTKPVAADAKYHIEDHNTCFYTPVSGEDMWVKVRGSADFVRLSISE